MVRPFVEDLAPRLPRAFRGAMARSSYTVSPAALSAAAAVSQEARRALRRLVRSVLALFAVGHVEFSGTRQADVDPERLRAAKSIWIEEWDGTSLNELFASVQRGSGSHVGAAFLRSITICNCPNLSDVSLLGTVESLRDVYIDLCPQFADVSPLASVRKVHISDCPRVVDIAPLSRASRVDLSDLLIADVASLAAVPKVSLSSFPNLRDLSPLARVHKLKLASLPWVDNLDCFTERVHTLHVNGCDGVSTLPANMGESVRAVELCNLVGFAGDLTPLKSVASVSLHVVRNVVDVSPLSEASYVYLGGCSNSVDLAPLAAADQVVLWRCPNVRNAHLLKRLHVED